MNLDRDTIQQIFFVYSYANCIGDMNQTFHSLQDVRYRHHNYYLTNTYYLKGLPVEESYVKFIKYTNNIDMKLQ